MPLTRRELLLGLVSAATMAGCARGRPLVPAESAEGTGKVTNYPFRRADIEALQTPCIGVTLGNTVPGAMFLTRYESGNGLRWESTNHVSLVTRGGRLVATQGLRRDIVTTRYDSADPLIEPTRAASSRFLRQVDLVPGDHRDVRYESVLTVQQDEFLTILEQTHRAIRISESLRVKRWNWSAENTYWVEVGSGSVLRSIQHIAPDSPVLTIDLLVPPA